METLDATFFKKGNFVKGNFALKFSRAFNTGDSRDFKMELDIIKFIYMFGNYQNNKTLYDYLRGRWGTLDFTFFEEKESS